MGASASEVRQFAVAACAHHARGDARTRSAYVQAQTQMLRAFAGDREAQELIDRMDAQAAELTTARRQLTAAGPASGGDGDFLTAAAALEHTTHELIVRAAR